MKKLFLFIIILGVLAGGAYWWRAQSANNPQSAAPPTTVRVERGLIRLVVSSTGKVVSNLDVEIKCKASGEVVKLPFDVSDVVKKGDLLMELDPVDEQRSVRQAQVSLSASEARLVSARQNLLVAERTLATDRMRAEAALKSAQARARDATAKAGRVAELLKQKLASPEDYETAETTAIQAAGDEEQAKVKLEELNTQEQALEVTRQAVRLAETAVESDRIALDLAEQSLLDTKVVAPIDGIVTARNVQVGQIISSGISNVGGGTTAMTLSDLSHIFVLASVDESEIGKVSVGQPVNITADAFPGKRFGGRVVRIATRGVNVSNVVTFEVKIEVLARQKSLLRPEMTANVEIVAAEKEGVLMAPAEGILRRAGQQVVTVINGGVEEERPVETGISDGVNVEVVSGLNEGDSVVVRRGETDSRWRGNPSRQMTPVRALGGGRGPGR